MGCHFLYITSRKYTATKYRLFQIPHLLYTQLLTSCRCQVPEGYSSYLSSRVTFVYLNAWHKWRLRHLYSHHKESEKSYSNATSCRRYKDRAILTALVTMCQDRHHYSLVGFGASRIFGHHNSENDKRFSTLSTPHDPATSLLETISNSNKSCVSNWKVWTVRCLCHISSKHAPKSICQQYPLIHLNHPYLIKSTRRPYLRISDFWFEWDALRARQSASVTIFCEWMMINNLSRSHLQKTVLCEHCAMFTKEYCLYLKNDL